MAILAQSAQAASPTATRVQEETSAPAEELTFATTGTMYPYNYKCDDPRGFCGFEVDLLTAICDEMKVQCKWIEKPWNGASLTDIASLLGGLAAPDAAGDYLAVNVTSYSYPRRLKLLASAPYLGANNLFIGRKNSSIQFGNDGFPKTDQPIKIGVLKGNAEAELRQHYGKTLGKIQIVAYDQMPKDQLKSGEINAIYAWDGIPEQIARTYPGEFEEIGPGIPERVTDPFNFVSILGRADRSALRKLEIINQGLVRIRRNGKYLKISEHWFGKDMWPKIGGLRLNPSDVPPLTDKPISETNFSDTPPPVKELTFATTGSMFPYNYKCKEDPHGICGFEVELFDAVCKKMNVKCNWILKDWKGASLTDKDSLLGGLAAQDAAEDYLAVNVTSYSDVRRSQLLASSHYLGANNLFIGKRDSAIQFGSDGFPKTDQPTKIGVLKGNAEAELRQHYGSNLGKIQIIAYDQIPQEQLENGEINTIYAWDGVPQQIARRYPGEFEEIGPGIPEWSQDPFNFVSVLGRVDPSTLPKLEVLNEGLVKVREDGTYLELSKKWFHKDMWSKQAGPWLPSPEPEAGASAAAPTANCVVKAIEKEKAL